MKHSLLAFDYSLPFGPLQECFMSSTCIDFKGVSNDFKYVHLKPLVVSPRSKYVVTLQFEVQTDLNAIIITIDNLIVGGQIDIAYKMSWVTIMVDTTSRTVTLYVEEKPNQVKPIVLGDKRSFDQTHCKKVYSMQYDAKYITEKRIGVRMLGNKVSIVAAYELLRFT